MFKNVMQYLACIHDSWQRTNPENHDRISRMSAAHLQCTRGDLESLATIPVDRAVPIVTLIIDCTTDKKYFHLTREGSHEVSQASHTDNEDHEDTIKERANTLFQERAMTLFQQRVREIDVTDGVNLADVADFSTPSVTSDLTDTFRWTEWTDVDFRVLIDECIAAAKEEYEPGEGSGEEGDEKSVSDTHKQLISRKHTDRVPLNNVAGAISALATRMEPHQTLHILLTGCNTTMLVLPLKHKLSEELQSRVWLLCTNEVWPSDLSSCLWHHYGGLVSADLGAFRMNTRVLLDDFTAHWQRQMIVNPAFEEARQSQVESLADLVHLDRMDRVTSVGGYPKMELL